MLKTCSYFLFFCPLFIASWRAAATHGCAGVPVRTLPGRSEGEHRKTCGDGPAEGEEGQGPRTENKMSCERCRRCPLSAAFPGGDYTPLALGCIERARCRTRLRYISTGARFIVDCCFPFAAQEAFLLGGSKKAFIWFVSNSSSV